MPRVDFSQIPDANDFPVVPEGRYLCKLTSVLDTDKEGQPIRSSGGHDQWKLHFTIVEGQNVGRLLFDQITFSPDGMKRLKLICSRLGIDVSGALDLTPSLIKDKNVYVNTVIETYQGKRGNKIPYDGYERVDGTQAHAHVPAGAVASATGENLGEDDLPF
jgi:hypothetical protein